MALRVTYVGELGWELHVPVEFAVTVYEALMAAGEPHGIANAGYRAIESLRLEKGYRAWGADIGPDHSPLVAGLGWAVKLKQDTPFLGREALLEQRSRPLPRLLAGFTRRSRGGAARPRDDLPRRGAGRLARQRRLRLHGRQRASATAMSATRPGSTATHVLAGSYELEVAGERVPAQVFLGPLYDPKALRVRA